MRCRRPAPPVAAASRISTPPRTRYIPLVPFYLIFFPLRTSCNTVLSQEVGLIIIPSLLPSTVQSSLLDKLLHRHLSNPAHQTNLHAHYNVAYPPPSSAARPFPSYFSPEASTLVQAPKDPSIHKPLSMPTCLNKKLRWVTLGGQYDWTRKVYPSGPPPPFPQDIAALVEGLFPTMKAQAAIVNLYTPGDTLSLHRDVSEECDRPLASISVGCDGLFIAGLDNGGGEGSRSITMRLRSGDVVLMTGPSRYAWHGVPQILANTCPDWLKDWPAGEATEDGEGEGFDHWRGWMTKKRINLNVRQMRD